MLGDDNVTLARKKSAIKSFIKWSPALVPNVSAVAPQFKIFIDGSEITVLQYLHCRPNAGVAGMGPNHSRFGIAGAGPTES